MKKIFTDLYSGVTGSFKNSPDGYSSKKLTAFAIMVCVIVAHAKWWRTNDFTMLPTIIGLDFGFILALFGINVADKKVNGSTTTSLEQSADGNKTTLTDDHNVK